VHQIFLNKTQVHNRLNWLFQTLSGLLVTLIVKTIMKNNEEIMKKNHPNNIYKITKKY